MTNNITFTWVTGQTGVEEIEMADELARIGSERSFIHPRPFCGNSVSIIRTRLKECMIREAQRS